MNCCNNEFEEVSKKIKKEVYCISKCDVYTPGFGGLVAGGAQRAGLNKKTTTTKRAHINNGVEDKNTTMTVVYIITSKCHRQPAI